MKNVVRGGLVCLAVLVVLGTTAAVAQITRSRIYSTPAIPSEETLRRLNLRLAWKRYVPLDGRKDGLLRVDVDGRDILVVTRSGFVVRLDAETGELHWRTRIGKPYTILPFLAANSRAVYVAANADAFAIDRLSGNQIWEFRLPAGVSAPAAVDEERIYLPTATSRLYTLRLPDVIGADPDSISEGLARSGLYGTLNVTDRGTQPRLIWSDQTNVQLSFAPIQGPRELFVMGPSGRGMGFDKEPRDSGGTTELFRIALEGKVSVQPKAYGDTAFVGSDDAALYAINMTTGKLRWRHTAGTAISQPPAVIGKDVFVTSLREGMARLDRETGEARWKVPAGKILSLTNPRAARFLAANTRFVYATDASGRLLILDRNRGVTLSTFDTSAYRLPVTNEMTDRLYLASNDGLIACFHDRGQKEPIRHRKALEDAVTPLSVRLKEPISEPGGRSLRLQDLLVILRRDHKLTVLISEPSFRVAGLPDPRAGMVKVPRVDKKPLGEFLQMILDQVKSTYEIIGNSVQIVPAKSAVK